MQSREHRAGMKPRVPEDSPPAAGSLPAGSLPAEDSLREYKPAKA